MGLKIKLIIVFLQNAFRQPKINRDAECPVGVYFTHAVLKDAIKNKK